MAFDPSKPFDKIPVADEAELPAFDPSQGFSKVESSVEAPAFDPSKGFQKVQDAGPPVPRGQEGGWIASTPVTQSQIDQLAKKYKVDKEALGEWVGWFGGVGPDVGSLKAMAKQGAGWFGESILAGLPQFLAKKSTDENFQKALDELSDIVSHKKATLQKGTEFLGTVGASLAGGAAIGKAVPTLAKSYQLTAMPVGGAVSGLTHSTTGEELEGAAKGAIIGTAIPAAAGLAGKALRAGATKAAQYVLTGRESMETLLQQALKKKQPRIDLVGDLLTGERALAELTEDEIRLLAGASGTIEEAALRAADKLDKIQASVLRRLRAGSRDLEETLADKGGEAVRDAYLASVKDAAARKIAKEGTIRPLSRVEGWLIGFMDAKPAYEIMDKRLGTNIAKTQTEASKKLNEAEWAFAGHNQEASQLLKGMDETASAVQIAAPDKATTKLFDQVYDTGKALGLKLPERKNAIPQVLLPKEQYKFAIAAKTEETRLLDLAPRTRVADVPELASLAEEASLATGRTFKTVASLKTALGEMLADEGKLYARVRNSRDEWNAVLPEWVADKNLASVYNTTVGNLKKAYAMPAHLDALSRAGKVAEAAGDAVSAAYLTRHMDDLTGVGKDVLQETLHAANKYYGTLEQKINQAEGYEKKLLEGRATLPQMLQSLSGQVYNNALGLSPKAALQNLASPFTSSISEVGADYALRLFTEAQADMASIIAKGVQVQVKPHLAKYLGVQAGETITTRNPAVLAYNEGLIGPGWKKDLINPEALKLKQGALSTMADKVDKANSATVMAAFEASEKIGRATIALMGKRLAGDLLEDPKLINGLIKSPAYRDYLGKLAAQGAPREKFNEAVVDYLNSHTLLNYDKLNMSEYGRTVGPLFRQFTKWPSYSMGRIVQPFYEKGAVGGAAELAGGYLAPMASFHAVDALLRLDDSPRSKKLLGSKGLSDWAPGASTVPLMESSFGIQKTPLVGILVDTARAGKSVASGSARPEEALSKWTQQMYSNFGFGSSWLRFLGEDVPAVLGNRDYDKKEAPVERRLRGMGL